MNSTFLCRISRRRPARPLLLAPSQMPKRGRGGSERGRIAMLHALAHIEFSAIDLAFDLAGRFGAGFPAATSSTTGSRVGADEAMHFALLDRRLRALGSAYGDLPAHDGLWEAAAATGGRSARPAGGGSDGARGARARRHAGGGGAVRGGRRPAFGGDPGAHLSRRDTACRGGLEMVPIGAVNRRESSRFRPGSGWSAPISEASLSLHSTIQPATKPVCPAITTRALAVAEDV